jgi:hypothetical protein
VELIMALRDGTTQSRREGHVIPRARNCGEGRHVSAPALGLLELDTVG